MASTKDPVVLPYVMGVGPIEGSVTPVRPLWDGAVSRLMPQITFGHRLRGAFAFMTAGEVGKSSMQEMAFANLRGAEAIWTKTRIGGEDGQTHRALVCQGTACATEKILDTAFMKEAQGLLGAKRLVVGLPVRSVMLAMDADKGGPAFMGFLRFNLSLFRGGEGLPLTPAIFRMVDGQFESFFAEGLEPFLDDLEAGAEDEGEDSDSEFDDEDEGPRIELATNAPQTWPPVEVPETALADPVELGINVVMALDDGFADEVEDLGRPVFRMTENGFVELVTEVIEGDRRTGLLAYDQATPAAAAHFEGARLEPTKKGKISVPVAEKEAFVRGPDARTRLFSASVDKGLLFAFRMNDTPLEWRNTFWRLYADGIEALAAELKRDARVRKAKEPLPSLGWLRTAARHNEEMELPPGGTRIFRRAQVE